MKLVACVNNIIYDNKTTEAGTAWPKNQQQLLTTHWLHSS
jgi:hypothetical protein